MDIHGWHFANIEKHSEKTYLLDRECNIGLCGDWFIQGRIEAAFLSGYAMAQDVASILSLQSLKEYLAHLITKFYNERIL